MIINPSAPQSAFEAKLLYLFLMENKDKVFFDAMVNYAVKVDGKKYPVQFDHNIFHRKTNNGNDQFYIIDNKIVGKGTSGTVFSVTQKLIPNIDQKKFDKVDVEEVVKIGSFSKNPLSLNSVEILQNENRIGKEITYTHTRKTIFTPDGRYITLMQELKYNDLTQILFDDEYREPGLTTDQRLELSIQLLRALKKHFHDHNILHLDLKPDNIKVHFDLKTNKFYVYIFDFTLSKKEDAQTIKPLVGIGNTRYASPEQKKGGHTTKNSDSYSMGKIFEQIWKIFNIENENISDKPGGFNDIDDLDPLHKDLIKSQIEMMLKNSEKSRSGIDQTLLMLENVQLKRTIDEYSQLDPEAEEIIYPAYVAGLKARDEYIQISQESKTKVQMIEWINKHLDTFEDDPEAIKVFINTLDIAALHGLYSKDEILEKIDNIYKKLDDNLNQLKSFEKAPQDSKIIKSINKINKFRLGNIDDVENLNTQYTKKIKEYNKSYNEKIEATPMNIGFFSSKKESENVIQNEPTSIKLSRVD